MMRENMNFIMASFGKLLLTDRLNAHTILSAVFVNFDCELLIFEIIFLNLGHFYCILTNN